MGCSKALEAFMVLWVLSLITASFCLPLNTVKSWGRKTAQPQKNNLNFD